MCFAPWDAFSSMETVLLLLWQLLNNSLNRLCLKPLSARVMPSAKIPLLP